jgi:hypothetical protein
VKLELQQLTLLPSVSGSWLLLRARQAAITGGSVYTLQQKESINELGMGVAVILNAATTLTV